MLCEMTLPQRETFLKKSNQEWLPTWDTELSFAQGTSAILTTKWLSIAGVIYIVTSTCRVISLSSLLSLLTLLSMIFQIHT